MPEQGCRLVFDVAQRAGERPFLFVAVFVAVIAIGAVIALVSLELRRVATRQSSALKVLWAFLCAVLLAGAAAGIAAALSIPTSAEGAPVVEGRIEHFHPMPPTRHDTESFEVNGVWFAYSQDLLTFGFNQDVQAGGPIREGLPVRIHYVPARNYPGYAIVRLEICDE